MARWRHDGAAKAAPNNWSEALAKEAGPQGVRVNIVTPGPIITPGGDEIRKTITSAMGITDQQFFSTVPLEGRAGKAEDLAEAIVFLVSPRASYITGDNLFVSGGFGAHLPPSNLSARRRPPDIHVKGGRRASRFPNERVEYDRPALLDHAERPQGHDVSGRDRASLRHHPRQLGPERPI